jgi:hypothetical protein
MGFAGYVAFKNMRVITFYTFEDGHIGRNM